MVTWGDQQNVSNLEVKRGLFSFTEIKILSCQPLCELNKAQNIHPVCYSHGVGPFGGTEL